MSHLFSALTLRGIQFKHRIFVSPMCQYSSIDGMPNDWHLVHLGSRAVGGAALVMTEATAVSPAARISPADLGIWSDLHAEKLSQITAFIKSQGSVPAIQLAHAGRKASVNAPWEGGKVLDETQGGWEALAPSALPFEKTARAPKELTLTEINELIQDFVLATRRSLSAGFQVIELHFAHGYLAHEFLSPLSNQRIDLYGGSFENRIRLPLQIISEVKKNWPEKYPLFVRISATDWSEGGWDLPQSIELSRKLKDVGVDLVDCSSGGLVPNAKIVTGPGYQVPFSEEIRKNVGIPTGAVGLITTAEQANEIISLEKADVVFLARELLRRPYWPRHAAHQLGIDLPWPKPYERAKIRD